MNKRIPKRLSRGLVLLGMLLVTTLAGGGELRDFESDGCSLFPDGKPGDPALWCDCCLAHDVAYWRGGSAEERKRADEALRDCVLQRTGSASLAKLMYAGVRAGGHPVFPVWYRWGYGWTNRENYAPLTAAEEAMVQQKLLSAPGPSVCKTGQQAHASPVRIELPADWTAASAGGAREAIAVN